MRGLGGDPWCNLGGSLAGSRGEPYLAGNGPLIAGGFSVDLYRVPANVPTVFVFGFGRVNLPLLGGTLVPSVDVALLAVTNAAGKPR
ncbi:MAG TPA: hypothetical protein EYP98_16665 [Planctomycetes bacterium]|nr:hypothetical protein [Planctomycetota bacterium]